MKTLWATVIICAFALLFPSTLAAVPHDENEGEVHRILRISKSGEMKVSAETHFGHHVLTRGSYRVKHRAEGAIHTFTFIRIGAKDPREFPAEEIEVRTTALAMPKPLGVSLVYTEPEDSFDLVTKIVLAGENVEHVL